MNSLLRVALMLALSGAGVGPALAAQHDGREAAVGRITDIDASHGYVIAEFPNGRMFVTIDKRDIGKFIVGDDLRIDSFGRPLPPQPRSPRPPR
jgi:hypothetical protein